MSHGSTGDGTLDQILSRLRSAHVDAGVIDDQSWCIDGTVIRAARWPAGGGKEGSPRSPGTTPWGGPEAASPPRSTCKGYRADWIDDYPIGLGIKPAIRSKEDEGRSARPVEFDKDAYGRRSIVEDLIVRLKGCRRAFSRFEKTAKDFGGMIKMAFIERYLRLTCQ